MYIILAYFVYKLTLILQLTTQFWWLKNWAWEQEIAGSILSEQVMTKLPLSKAPKCSPSTMARAAHCVGYVCSLLPSVCVNSFLLHGLGYMQSKVIIPKCIKVQKDPDQLCIALIL